MAMVLLLSYIIDPKTRGLRKEISLALNIWELEFYFRHSNYVELTIEYTGLKREIWAEDRNLVIWYIYIH